MPAYTLSGFTVTVVYGSFCPFVSRSRLTASYGLDSMQVSCLHHSPAQSVDISRYQAVLSVLVFSYFRQYTGDRVTLKVLVSLSPPFSSSGNLIASRSSRRSSLRQLNKPCFSLSVRIQHPPFSSYSSSPILHGIFASVANSFRMPSVTRFRSALLEPF